MGTLVQIQLNHHRNNPQSFFWKIVKSSIGAIAGIVTPEEKHDSWIVTVIR